MFRLVEMEYLKNKNTAMFYISILGALFCPIMTLINEIYYISKGTSLGFQRYAQTSNMINIFLIGNLIFGLIAVFLIHREIEEDTLKNILCIPVKRSEFIIAKLIYLLIWILFLTIVQFIFIILTAFLVTMKGLNIQDVLKQFIIYIKSGFTLYCLSSFMFLVTLIFKEYMPALTFLIGSQVANLLIMGSKYSTYYPWTVPQYIIYPGANQGGASVFQSSIILGIFFVITTSLSIVYLKKSDL